MSAALVLGLALVAAALLSTGPHVGGLHAGSSAALTDRTPVLLRSADRPAVAAPRTTPPPTFPEPSTTERPAAATTVEHS